MEFMVMSYDWEEIQNVITEITEYAELDGPTSETEAIECMCGVLARPDYVDDTTLEAVLADVKNKLDYYKANAKIVKREETFTRTVTDLEWEYS